MTCQVDQGEQRDTPCRQVCTPLTEELPLNPLTAGVAYIRVFIFYQHINYHLLNMLKIKCDINQQYLKTVDLHFVKSE